MSYTETELLDLAIERIDAVEHGDGYRHFDAGTRTWWGVTRQETIDLGKRLARGEHDACSFWCAETSAEELGPMRRDPGYMIVPPTRQGQIVEVSYSDSYGDEGYKRVYDRSDRSEQWYYADTRHIDDDGWDPINREPQGLDWKPCLIED